MRELAYFGSHKDMKRLFPASVDAGMGAAIALVHPNDDNAFPIYSGDDAASIKQHAENLAVRVGGYVVQVTKATKLPVDDLSVDEKTDEASDTGPDADQKTT